MDEQHWLAAVTASGPELYVNPRLMETVIGSANWAVVENDFGGGFVDVPGIAAMHYEASSNRLYATEREALPMSTDLGRTWQLLSGFRDGFSHQEDALNVNLARGEVWFGGQNAFEQMDLRRHDWPVAIPSSATHSCCPHPRLSRVSLLILPIRRMITKVISRSRSTGSRHTSAGSNASRIRRRMVVASSTRFSLGANTAQSSFPK